MINKTVFELQEILFRLDDEKIDSKLFLLSEGYTYIENGNLVISGKTRVDFCTYFNAFSIAKWKKYTKINSVFLELNFKGKAEITLYSHKILYGEEIRSVVNRQIIDSEKSDKVMLLYNNNDKNVISYSYGIKTFTDDFRLFNARYVTNECIKENRVKLALIFTTYNREKYIKQNLEHIAKCDSEKIQVYVIDNASNLNIKSYNNVSVIKNQNVGGAGGFALGMINFIDNMKNERYTHCILMDDDANIDCKVIQRLINFLKYINSEYYGSFISGAMLRKDLSYYQVESGAKWNNGKIESNGHGIDLRKTYQWLNNNIEQPIEYAAWWFCVIPAEYIRNDNLPLPIFVFNDDVDFGLRNNPNIITLNGICVWHDAFESKKNAMRCYYESRNRLIVNSCNNIQESKNIYIKQLKKDILEAINLYQYDNAYAILEGVKDFLKGPKWLMELNSEAYNNAVAKKNVQLVDFDVLTVPYDWYRLCCTIKDCDILHRFIRKFTKNGYLLSADREVVLPFYASNVEAGYRAKKITYYDEITGKGFVVARDMKQRIKILKEYSVVKKLIWKRYDEISKLYRENYMYLISREQWEKYLKL